MYLESIKENAGQRPEGGKRPDLQEFIDSLRVQNNDFEKNAERLFYFANQFRDVRQPSEVEPLSPKHHEPQGIIDILGLELKRMQLCNTILNQTCEAFQRIIGD